MSAEKVAQLFPDKPEEECPEWLSEDWADFLESRKEIKKPMTKVARKRMLRKIERCEGAYARETIRQMLDDSMVNGWQNIYPENYAKKGASHADRNTGRQKLTPAQRVESAYRDRFDSSDC